MIASVSRQLPLMRLAGCALLGILLAASSLPAQSSRASDSKIVEFSGPTMGTKFTVKIFDPQDVDRDLQLKVDALLRQINDEVAARC